MSVSSRDLIGCQVWEEQVQVQVQLPLQVLLLCRQLSGAVAKRGQQLD